jgi:catechol 1,2-dioxygenase
VPERNERAVEIWDGAVAAMRQLVSELMITENELHLAAEFFDQMGKENNFHTLLFATLSTASDEALYRSRGVSHSNVVGPRYKPKAPLRPDGNLLDRPAEPGAQPFELSGRVYDVATGEPVPGAELDVWQADHNGLYDDDGYHLRGIVVADKAGRYRITSVLPADYPSHWDDTITTIYALIGRGTLRAAHVHMNVSLDGRHVLTTQVFRSDSPSLDDDLVIGIVKPELIGTVVPPEPGSGLPWKMEFDIPVRVQQVELTDV